MTDREKSAGTPTQTDLAFNRESPYGTRAEPTYSGALSFLRRRYTKDLDGVDVAVIGVPFDLATTNRPGTRLAMPQPVTPIRSGASSATSQAKVGELRKSPMSTSMATES